jgi:uncharacterized protein YjbJ (UPF0337 family)
MKRAKARRSGSNATISSVSIELSAPAAAMPFAGTGSSMRYVVNCSDEAKGKIARATAARTRALTRQTTYSPIRRSVHMNWDRVEGNWKQFTGKVKEKWGKLTDDDLQVINGQQDQLVGRIQERYGVAKDEAQKQVKNWVGGL